MPFSVFITFSEFKAAAPTKNHSSRVVLPPDSLDKEPEIPPVIPVTTSSSGS